MIQYKYLEENPCPFSIGSRSTTQYTMSIKNTKIKTINVRKHNIVCLR